jgi:hypothetical protein
VAARIPRLRERAAWKALQVRHLEMRDVHLRRLFADDPGRLASR